MGEAVALGCGCCLEGAFDDGVEGDFAGVEGLVEFGVFVHHPGEERAVEGAPVDADADGTIVLNGAFDHGAEVVVGLAADVYVAGVDAVFGEGACAVWILTQEQVAVVMEVADQRDGNTMQHERVFNFGNCCCGCVGVDRDTDNFGAGFGEFHDLLCGGCYILRICIRHGLNHDRIGATDFDATDIDNCAFTTDYRHESLLKPQFYQSEAGNGAKLF